MKNRERKEKKYHKHEKKLGGYEVGKVRGNGIRISECGIGKAERKMRVMRGGLDVVGWEVVKFENKAGNG